MIAFHENNIAKKIFWLTVFTILIQMPCKSQYKVVFEEDSNQVLYSISQSLQSTNQKKFFPEYDYYAPTNEGFEIKDSVIYLREINLDSLPSNVYLNSQVYSQNISAIDFFISSTNQDKCFHIKQEMSYDGFQDPEEFKFNEVDFNEKICFDLRGRKNVNMKIQYSKREKNRPSELVFRFLKIVKKTTYSQQSNVPFFKGLASIGKVDSTTIGKDMKMSNWEHIPSEKNYNYMQGNLNLIPEGNEVSEFDLFKNVIIRSLELYPFYKIRNLNRSVILKEYSKEINEIPVDSLCLLARKTSRFLKTRIKDLHFHVTSGCGTNEKMKINDGGIKLYQIKDKVFIAASFDSLNGKRFPTGSEVTHINDRPIKNLQEESKKRLTSSFLEYDSLALNRQILKGLINGTDGGPVNLTIVKPNDINYQESVSFVKTSYKVPSNFRPVQCEFRILNDNVVYYRINIWSSEVYTRLVNNMKEIRSRKHIIFDIRGNGGGDQFSAMQIISMFINKPQVVYYYKPTYQETTGLDSVVIKADKYYSLKNLSATILIDNNSASASEIFTQSMSSLKNVSIVGQEKTRGSVSSRYKINFPSGIQLSCNSIVNPPSYDNIEIETIGIEPDFYVPIESIQDLRPYKDKILSKAIEISN